MIIMNISIARLSKQSWNTMHLQQQQQAKYIYNKSNQTTANRQGQQFKQLKQEHNGFHINSKVEQS